jgi:GT2 family glycosyltransferase/glycosyltransferase involved in cell wall biosynthesis
MTRGSLFLVIRMRKGHGVSETAAEAARALAHRGHQVTIGCVEPPDNFAGLDIRVVPAQPAEIETLARAIGAETVVALSAPYFDALPALPPDLLRLAWEAGDPTPGLFPPPEAQTRTGWAEEKRARVYPHIDGVMTVSEFLISDIGWPDAVVVPNGADHAGHHAGRAKRPEGPLRIGLLARLGAGEARYKGFALAAPMLAELRARDVDAVLEVMGRGTPADAAPLRAQGCKVHLNATDEERAVFLSTIDVFVSLSLWEGFDLPVVEAQWLGTPALALDTGAHPEVTPLLMPDLGGLVDLLENYARDPALLAVHGKLCRDFVASRFRWDTTAERYLAACERFRATRRRATTMAPSPYARWLAQHGSPTAQELDAMRAVGATWRPPPLVSILVDASRGSEAGLGRLLSSLRDQTYPAWEALLVGGQPSAATDAPRDDRIRADAGFATVHAALAAARGPWAMVVDGGAVLAPHALHLLVAAATQSPTIGVAYPDEDRIDSNGLRSDPVFRCAIDPDLLPASGIVGRGAVFGTDLLRQEAARDPDCTSAALLHAAALEALRRHGRQGFAHVPCVLHHAGADQQPLELSALERIAAQHAERCGDGATQEPNPLVPGTLRIRRRLLDPAPHVSVIVPTRDRADLLGPCLDGVLNRTDYPSLDVVIVDNGSSAAETLDLFGRLSADPRVRILPAPGPFNYARLVNAGVAASTGEVLALLNNDVEVIAPDWLAEMVSHAVRPDIGAVGAKLLYPDGTVQHAGVVLGIGWPGGVAGHMHVGAAAGDPGPHGLLGLTRSVSAVTGACLVVRRALYRDLQGLDEANLAVDFNDVDFCLRLQEKGYRNLWTPFAALYHKESVSRGRSRSAGQEERFRKEVAYMRERWGALLDNDPWWNPNLSLATNVFALADSPRGERPWAIDG